MPLAGSIDLFTLMVEYVAGSIPLSIALWALILLITGIIGRLTMESIMIIISTFLIASSIGYFGALWSAIALIIAIWYAVTGIINWWQSMR